MTVYDSIVSINARITLWVVEIGTIEVNVIWPQLHGVVNKMITNLGEWNTHAALFHNSIALDINTLERTEYAHPSCCSSLKVIENCACPFVYELQIDMCCIHVEVYSVIVNIFLRCDVTFYESSSFVGRVNNVAIEEDRVGTVAPIEMNIEVAHRSVVQGKLRNADVCIGFRRRHKRVSVGMSCGFSSQFHSMEVD